MLRQFDESTALPSSSAEPDIAYHVAHESNAWVVRCGQRHVGTTRFLEDVVATIELDALREVETWYAQGLWVHAASVVGSNGRAMLAVGASDAGKSSAALAFCRNGWGYLGDDAVMLCPESGTVSGMTWAIRLQALPVPAEALASEGFAIARHRYVHENGAVERSYRVRPPMACSLAASAPATLGGIVFLERGARTLRQLQAGEMLLRLWPQRIARVDGADPWSPTALANQLAMVPAAVLRTQHLDEVPELVEPWFDAVSS